MSEKIVSTVGKGQDRVAARKNLKALKQMISKAASALARVNYVQYKTNLGREVVARAATGEDVFLYLAEVAKDAWKLELELSGLCPPSELTNNAQAT